MKYCKTMVALVPMLALACSSTVRTLSTDDGFEVRLEQRDEIVRVEWSEALARSFNDLEVTGQEVGIDVVLFPIKEDDPAAGFVIKGYAVGGGAGSIRFLFENPSRVLHLKIIEGEVRAFEFEGVGRAPGDLFAEYVASFEIDSSIEGVPGLEKLPQAVYEDVLALRETDARRYQLLVCEMLMKYDDFYREYFRQSYSLVNPDEMKFKAYAVEGNNKFFLLRCFMEFTNTKVEDEDGFPSNSIRWWYENKFSNEYPYRASQGRIDEVLRLKDKLTPGMKASRVKEIMGTPNNVQTLLEPRIKNARQVGVSYVYILQALKPEGSVNDRGEVYLRVSFDLNDTVTAIDLIGMDDLQR